MLTSRRWPLGAVLRDARDLQRRGGRPGAGRGPHLHGRGRHREQRRPRDRSLQGAPPPIGGKDGVLQCRRLGRERDVSASRSVVNSGRADNLSIDLRTRLAGLRMLCTRLAGEASPLDRSVVPTRGS